MADVEVIVEETPPVSEDVSRETSAGTDHAEEVIVDAGIVAGVSAVQAAEDAQEAGESAVAAEIHANQAEAAAGAVHAENEDLRTIANDLRATAAMLAGVQASHMTEQSGLLPEPGEAIDPNVDIEPENTHFLTRKWNVPFSRKNKVD